LSFRASEMLNLKSANEIAVSFIYSFRLSKV